MQVRMEYLLLNNLDAAIKDQPKPALFGPSAGATGGGVTEASSQTAMQLRN